MACPVCFNTDRWSPNWIDGAHYHWSGGNVLSDARLDTWREGWVMIQFPARNGSCRTHGTVTLRTRTMGGVSLAACP